MPKPKTLADWEVVLTKYYTGYDLNELVKEYQVSKQAIMNRIRYVDYKKSLLKSRPNRFRL